MTSTTSDSTSRDPALSALAAHHSHVFTYLRTPAGELRHASPQSEKFLQLKASKVIGLNLRNLLAPGVVNQNRWLALSAAVDRGDLNPHAELELLGQRESPLWVVLHESILAADEQPTGAEPLIVGTAIDITERRLQESQLQQAQRLENLGLLAAGIAHDLNNILAPILIAGSLLRPLAQDDRQRRMTDILQASAERGAQIVRQILRFAQGNQSERGPVNPRHLLRDVLLMIQETFPCGIEIEDNIAANLHQIQANPSQIHQILLNLCINARDAMPAGGTLRLEAADCTIDEPPPAVGVSRDQRDWVRLTVADSGVGIPPDRLEQIWLPFFTTKGTGEGTGLGLSTVRGIVTAHGGFINLHSRLGHGTTFEIYLPALPSVDGLHATDEPNLGRARGSGERILVVDDEQAVRAIINATLGARGYEIIGAADGVEALATVNLLGDQLALIITDVHMPHMTGDVLVNVLKRMRPDLPIIAISGHPDAEKKWEHTDQLPPDVYIHKPFTGPKLINTVEMLLHPPGK